ncbi:MAG: hypothetical protein ABSA41_06975 [Terriglobia bacterium]|jgi:hypothetical protein
MACAENQAIEIKAVAKPAQRPGWRERKDVKDDGRSGYIYENKRLRKPLAGRSGDVADG